jgi:hypothetical protein
MPLAAQSRMLFPLHCMDLLKQDLFMVETNPVGRCVEVVQADLTDQRFFPLIFTPGADNFHTRLNEQS